MRTGAAAFLKSEVTYVADLFGAGMQGVASAWKETGDHAFRPHSARAIWAPTAVGAAIGLLSACLDRKCTRPGYRVAMSGLAGTALGLGVGLAWTTRSVTRAAARDAIRNVNAVRDAHWLERNPIAYA